MSSKQFPLFKQGDRNAMKHYHNHFRSIVFTFLNLLTFNKEFALCLEKKTFLMVFALHSEIENEPSLLRMLIRTAWKLSRGNGGGPNDGSDLPEDGPVPEVTLLKVFEQLSPRRKQVMKLFYTEGSSIKEIAVMLQLDEQTIRNNISKSLLLLSQQFAGSVGETDLVFA